MVTPHLDRLAANARSFSHHYTHVPTCGASRASSLHGRYPDRLAHLSNGAITKTRPDWAGRSRPGWFKQQGYQTPALGNITLYPRGRTGKLWANGPEELPTVCYRAWIPDTPWVEP